MNIFSVWHMTKNNKNTHVRSACLFPLLYRCLTTTPRLLAGDSGDKKPAAERQNLSFVANMFRGELQPKEVFPYPNPLDAEQRENIAAFVDPVTSFFTVFMAKNLS